MHPVYSQRLAEWLYLRASYLGEPEWSRQGITGSRPFPFFADSEEDDTDSTHIINRAERSYLSRHAREEDSDYENRLALTPYFNFVKPFVAAWVGAIMRALKAPEVPAQMVDWLEDVDGQGTSWAKHAEYWLTVAVVEGHGHSYLSMPPAPKEEPASLAHEQALGRTAHARVCWPPELLDWSHNPERGVYEWAQLRYPTALRKAPPDVPDTTPVTNTASTQLPCVADVLVTPTAITTVIGTDVVPGSGPGFVALVTLIAQDDPTTGEPCGWSQIRDVADAAREAYNQLSWMLDQEKNSCFSQLVLKTQRKLTRTKALRLGTSTYIASELGADYITPDMGPLTHLSEQIPKTVESARVMVALDNQGTEGVEAASALAMRREALDTALATLAEKAQSAFRAELRMVATLMGADPEAVKVEIGRDFSGLTRIARMEQALAAIEKAQFSGLALAELQKMILDALLPDLDDADREALHADIEDVASTALEAEQKMAENPMGAPVDENGDPTSAPSGAPPGLKPGMPKVAQKPGKPFGGGKAFGK